MRKRSEPSLSYPFKSVVLSLVGGMSLLTGCSNFKVTDPGYYAALSASATTIRVNQQLQIVNNEKATGVPLTFYVNGVAGGNAELGTIDGNGLYTAPAIVPTPNNTVTITSLATSSPSDPPGSVALGVLNPIPILTSVTPTGFSEGTTTVTVAGSEFVYGAQISWNGTPVTTTYVSSTQLVAEIAAPNPGTFPLLVTNPNPGSANSATAQVKVAPGQVVLQLQPNTGSDVRVTNSMNFGLTVTGTNNPAVTLAMNGIAGGNAQLGTAVVELGWIDHVYRTGGGSDAQQRCSDDDHERRQSDGFYYAEHFGDESDSDSDFGHSDDVQRGIAIDSVGADRPEIYYRCARLLVNGSRHRRHSTAERS